MCNLHKQKIKITGMKPALTVQIKHCVRLPPRCDMMQLLFTHAMAEKIKGEISVQTENTGLLFL